MGLGSLAKDPHLALVVTTDDTQLAEVRNRLRSYSGQVPGGAEYGGLDVIQDISPLTAEDRTGRQLRDRPLQPSGTRTMRH